jgi:hypothetical protein
MARITDALKVSFARGVTPQAINKSVPILLSICHRDDRIDVIDCYMASTDPLTADLALSFNPVLLVSFAVFLVPRKLLAGLFKDFSNQRRTREGTP